jgi:hypothetical protein
MAEFIRVGGEFFNLKHVVSVRDNDMEPERNMVFVELSNGRRSEFNDQDADALRWYLATRGGPEGTSALDVGNEYAEMLRAQQAQQKWNKALRELRERGCWAGNANGRDAGHSQIAELYEACQRLHYPRLTIVWSDLAEAEANTVWGQRGEEEAQAIGMSAADDDCCEMRGEWVDGFSREWLEIVRRNYPEQDVEIYVRQAAARN